MGIRNFVFKGTLLSGLLLTGLVLDEGARADTATQPSSQAALPFLLPHEAGPLWQLTAEEHEAIASSPAQIILLVEGPNGAEAKYIYFPRDLVRLTQEAASVLMEIAAELESEDIVSISITSDDPDQLLAFERTDLVAKALETYGFSKARLFTFAEPDILTTRGL